MTSILAGEVKVPLMLRIRRMSQGACVALALSALACLERNREDPSYLEKSVSSRVCVADGWTIQNTLSVANARLMYRPLGAAGYIVLDLATGQSRDIPTTSYKLGLFGGPIFSPERDKWVGFEYDELFVVRRDSGMRVIRRADERNMQYGGILPSSRFAPEVYPDTGRQWTGFSDDGRNVYYLERNNKLGEEDVFVQVDVDSGNRTVCLPDLRIGQEVRGVAVVASLRKAYLTIDRRVEVWNYESRRRECVYELPAEGSQIAVRNDGAYIFASRHSSLGSVGSRFRNDDFREGLGGWVIDAETGLVIMDVPFGWCFAWAATAPMLAFARWNDELWTLNVVSREMTRVAYLMHDAVDDRVPRDSPLWWGPAWSSNDRYLAAGLSRWSASTRTTVGSIVVVDVEKRELMQFDGILAKAIQWLPEDWSK